MSATRFLMRHEQTLRLFCVVKTIRTKQSNVSKNISVGTAGNGIIPHKLLVN